MACFCFNWLQGYLLFFNYLFESNITDFQTDHFILINTLTKPNKMSQLAIKYEKCLARQLSSILHTDVSNSRKILLLQGFLSQLKQQQQTEKWKMKQNMSTSISQSQSNFTADEQEIEELEDRILRKRVVKFQINQEIQTNEEDLFQAEQTVEAKRKKDEYLRKKIERKMKVIESEEETIDQPEKSYLNKSFETVSGLFKGWLY